MYFLNITEIAQEDILSAVRYIAEVLKSPMAANTLLDNIEKEQEILEEMPNIYPFVRDEHLASNGLKFVMIRNYALFYTVNEDEKTVNVIRFLYGRRDWQNILKSQSNK